MRASGAGHGQGSAIPAAPSSPRSQCALEMAGVDRDRAALVVGHEREFTFRVYNPEGMDLAMLGEVIELVRHHRLELPW